MLNPERLRAENLFYRLSFKQPNSPVGSVVMVDDYEGTITCLDYFFNRKGYTLTGYVVHEKLQPTLSEERGLAETIINTGANVAILDMGIGMFDGLALSARLREAGIATMILTGASRFDDHIQDAMKVSDQLLHKPMDPYEIVNACDAVLGLQR